MRLPVRKLNVPSKPRTKLPPRQPLEKQVGTITPEQFGRGDAYWAGRRREGHRTTPSEVIKPMAEDIVAALIDEAMNRRGFLGRLAAALAGMAVAPAAAVMPSAAGAAAPVWTVNMQRVLAQIAERFVDERLGGFSTPDGQTYPPAAVEDVKRRWATHLPKFKQVLLSPDAAMDARFGLLKSPPYAGPEPVPSGYARAEKTAQEWKDFNDLGEPMTPAEEEKMRREQNKETAQQKPAPRQAKRVWPPRQQQGREEPWTDVDIMPESIAEGLADWLLEDEEWSPNWQPDANILAWFRKALSLFKKDGQTWVLPGSGQAYLVFPSQKVLVMLGGDPNDPKHWHDKTKRSIEALGWTMGSFDEETPEDDGDPDVMSFAEGVTGKQNKFNPKGLRRDHRGNLLDKWGRKMEVDWNEFDKRRVKAADVNEPYLKPPAQKNPLHNSTRPVR